MVNMLAGLRLYFLSLNCLHRRPSYHHSFGILRRKNLPKERTVIGAVVMEAIVEIIEMFSFGEKIFELLHL